MQIKVSNFLYRHGMHYNTIELALQAEAFMEEMKAGLNGKPSSLMMIPAFTRIGGNLAKNGEVIAIDAGGTNLRIATVRFSPEKSPVIEYLNKYPMPGTQGRVSIKQFADKIAEYLEPILSVSNHIGFCFSFPANILEDGDGEILGFNKEVLVEDAKGCRLGQVINNALIKKGETPKTFTVVNDTTATMLGGAASQHKEYCSYIGFILGTGTNTCCIDSVPLASGKREEMAVNLESGGYNKFVQGDFDKKVDEQSANPKDHQLEKMMSGAYFGALIHTTIAKACEEGLLSLDFAKSFARLSQLTMIQVDTFCENAFGQNDLALIAEDGDRQTLYEIIDAIYERAARMAIVNLCGIMLKIGVGRSPVNPVCVCAEGTFFYKSPIFRSKLDYYCESFLKRTMGLYCEFKKTDNATIIGAAAAAMVHKTGSPYL